MTVGIHIIRDQVKPKSKLQYSNLYSTIILVAAQGVKLLRRRISNHVLFVAGIFELVYKSETHFRCALSRLFFDDLSNAVMSQSCSGRELYYLPIENMSAVRLKMRGSAVAEIKSLDLRP